MTASQASSDPVGPGYGAPPLRPSQRFVARVITLCEDKAARAALRSGLGRPVEQCNRLHRYLVRLTPEHLHPDARRAHYAVAALIAGRPRGARAAEPGQRDSEDVPAPWSWRANLGATLAEGVRNGALAPDSAEGELHLITRQSTAALHPRLPSLTRHLLSKNAPIHWAVLLEDLSWWDRNRDRIATRWLESYFRTLYAAPDDPVQPAMITTGTNEQDREDHR